MRQNSMRVNFCNFANMQISAGMLLSEYYHLHFTSYEEIMLNYIAL